MSNVYPIRGGAKGEGAPEPVAADRAEEQAAYDEVVDRLAARLAFQDQHDHKFRYATSVLREYVVPDIVWLQGMRDRVEELGLAKHGDWETDVCIEANQKFEDHPEQVELRVREWREAHPGSGY